MNYSTYHLSTKELGSVVIKTVIVTVGIMLLFYRSIGAIVVFPFFFVHLGEWLCLSSRLAYWRRKWEPLPSAEKAAICRAAAQQNILPGSKSGREEEPQQTSFTS